MAADVLMVGGCVLLRALRPARPGGRAAPPDSWPPACAAQHVLSPWFKGRRLPVEQMEEAMGQVRRGSLVVGGRCAGVKAGARMVSASLTP